jgi:uncharacterized membrane protein
MKETKGGTTMKGLTLSLGLATLACLTMSGMAQDSAPAAPEILYTFEVVNYPGDTFTQLLGINNSETIAGYHGNGTLPSHPFSGFTLVLPHTFTTENFPGAVQTQVIGINNNAASKTCGFYIDTKMANHGFIKVGPSYLTIDFPATTSVPPVNQLLGLNDSAQQAGYWQDSSGNFHAYITGGGTFFLGLTIPKVPSAQATGINNKGWITGFYIDSAMVTHGFVLTQGTFRTIDYPRATATSVLGSNNNGQLVGTYTDSAGGVHGFVYNTATATFQTVDAPEGVGTTMINGINDKGVIVGFFGPCAVGGLTCEGLVGTP